ncbi:MAG TPA: hypothetical protein VLC92_01210 [Rhodocyclaceae bacterium]|nr:hypothetical protein [Rhodocyclaceae bacterium]
MTNEARVFVGAQKTLESVGAAITNNSVAQADDANYSLSADGANYPDAEFVLTATFATAPTEGTALSLYARPLDVDGTGDTEIPEAARPTMFIGSFFVNNVTTAQLMVLRAYELPTLATYYIHNNGTGQTVSAGWILKVTPRTIGPA